MNGNQNKTLPSTDRQYSRSRMMKFLLPSIIGVLIFMTPIKHDDQYTILVGILIGWISNSFESLLVETVIGVTVIAVLGNIYYLLAKPDWQRRNPILYAAFSATPAWLLLRTVGALFGLMVYFEFGPELIWGESTGHAVFNDIGTAMLVVFVTACMFMPFLTEFGFTEFIGTLAGNVFSRLFKLPGRAAVDATASFVGAASVGLLITINQYERGQYSAREAASVATNFSVVSISFSLVMAQVAKIDHIFLSWYLTVCIACFLCAVIMVRIPPLSRIPETYFEPVGKQVQEFAGQDTPLLKRCLYGAMERAKSGPGPRIFIRSALHSLASVTFGIIGPTMALATATTIIVFHTPVFEILTYPILWLLEMVGVPEFSTAAPGFLAGFLDQFMPVLIASNIQSELTRFILAGFSVSQLIFMAEVGILILHSSLPLNFKDLLIIFLMRTAILFPIFLVAGLLLI